MAELAIPLIALGSMYIISQQDKKKENLTNMSNNSNSLPNTKPIAINYPIQTSVPKDNVEVYTNPNQTTDKFFNPANYLKNTETKMKQHKIPQTITSMSGNSILPDDFKHNNMTPYFGAKIRGATIDSNITEGILDNMQGTGSQQFSKKEITPLFKPQDNMQWAYGAPNQSDFFQSRVNPSLRMSNVKPWEEKIVGPALDNGYNTNGSNGFNSGMEARDKWLPKSVDELRTLTNPKITFGLKGHEGPALNLVQNRGILGAVEKNLPDTYYNNTPDRWLTTTGIEKAQTARGIEVLQDVSRTGTTKEYFGTGSLAEGRAGYAPQNYQSSVRTETINTEKPVPNAIGKNPATTADYGRDSYNFLPTNRNTTCYEDRGTISGIMKNVIAPLLDILRPTRKEDIVNNSRPYEIAGYKVSAGNVYNPADKTKTTNREMQEDKLDNNHLNIQNQTNDAYIISEQQAIDNNRDTTSTAYIGTSGGSFSQSGPMTYNAAYNQHNNPNKTYLNHPNHGVAQIFNQNENIKINKIDNDRDNNRLWVRGTGSSVASINTPSLETIGTSHGHQEYDNINCERMQPDILNAFKQNPYTQSLNSWA